jgi:hypothetical protein
MPDLRRPAWANREAVTELKVARVRGGGGSGAFRFALGLELAGESSKAEVSVRRWCG